MKTHLTRENFARKVIDSSNSEPSNTQTIKHPELLSQGFFSLCVVELRSVREGR
jgi:hypothetical protein